MMPPWTRRREFLRRLARRPPAEEVLLRWHAWAYAHDDVFFVQIGSNDGLRSDPLRVHLDRQPWRGVMVEPQPAVFEQLSERRRDPRFELVQAAITDHDGTVMMTTFSGDQDRTYLATIEPAMAEYYHLPKIEIEVPAMTFSTLTRDVDDIHVLHVDTEGHDAAILAQVDFDAWTLSAILFEHAHLALEDYEALVERLHSHGFTTQANHTETLCLRG